MKPRLSFRGLSLRITMMGLLTAMLGIAAGNSKAALVVSSNLGALGPGTVNLNGTTVGGPNNANNYTNTSATSFWGSEFVYQFSIGGTSTLSMTSNDPNGGAIDNDFFLLNTLATTPSGANNVGSTLGPFIEVSGTFGNFAAGTYYLSIDAFSGGNSSGTGSAGAFSVAFTVSTFEPPPPPASTAAMPGGSIIANLDAGEVFWFDFMHPGGAFSVDTFGSSLAPDNDTELFLFDSLANITAQNDDAGPAFLSRINLANLPAGQYFLAAAGFNSVGATGFSVNSGSVEAGELVINGIQPVPEPGAVALALAGAVTTLRRRRVSR